MVIQKGVHDRVDASQVRVKLICIPQAGMGSWCFQGWQSEMPEGIEVLPVELPGRGARAMQPTWREWPTMIKELCDELQAAGCFDTRYCLLGHSLGGWIAHELARELSSRGVRLPELCIIASIRAPCVGGASHDPDGPITHLQPSSAFWEEFFLRYGRNPDLLDDGLQAFVEPLLRSDLRLVETYTPSQVVGQPLGGMLPCPVLAVGTVGDDRLRAGQLEAWRRHTESADRADIRWFRSTHPPWSNPHRHIVDDAFVMQDLLRQQLSAMLQHRPMPHRGPRLAREVEPPIQPPPQGDALPW
jgi:medium-chain acyl-[acyl-carrier-protein] hydrolase